MICSIIHSIEYAKVTLKTDNGNELFRSERAGSFYMQTIKCSQNIDQCYIVCKDYRSCISNMICKDNNQCNIKCDGKESCTTIDTVIITENNKYLNIHCNGDNSCSNGLQLKVSNITNIINIECNGIESCSNIDLFEINNINMFSDKDILIECNGMASCTNITYNFAKIILSDWNRNKINIICNGKGSCNGNYINVLFIKKLYINCKHNCNDVVVNRIYNKYDTDFVLDAQCHENTHSISLNIDYNNIFELNGLCFYGIVYQHNTELYHYCF